MPERFNADEVFNMAVKIETNGAEFYRKAAALQEDEKNRNFLNGLAKMEDRHKKVFEEMRHAFTEKGMGEETFDPDGEGSAYLHALAAAHGGEGSPKVADSLTGSETMKQILDIAIDLEKKSILYYVGLRELVPQSLGKDTIDKIITEEHKHVAQISQVLSRM
jgi:rubrerythrin